MRKVIFLLSGLAVVAVVFFLGMGSQLNLNALPFPDLGLPCFLNCEKEPPDKSGVIIRDRIELQGLLQSASRIYDYDLKRKQPIDILADPEMSFRGYITVTAVLDLENLSSDAVSLEGTVAIVQLPPAQVMECFLDERESRYYDVRNCDILGSGVRTNSVCEQMKADLRLDALEAAANDDHSELLSIAFESAADTLRPLLADIEGVTEIRFEQSGEAAPVFHPEGSCKDYEILPES
jgi:hypothetical protein